MKRSESIASIAAALAKAQGAIRNVTKSKVASVQGRDGRAGYKYGYADLADVLDVAREPLSQNGIALVQTTEDSDRGVRVVTTLVHASGEWMEGALTLPVRQADAQGVGSAITYARRYAVCAMLGIAADDEDDDAHAATDHGPGTRQAPAPAPSAPARGRDRPASIDEMASADLATTIELDMRSASTDAEVVDIGKRAKRELTDKRLIPAHYEKICKLYTELRRGFQTGAHVAATRAGAA